MTWRYLRDDFAMISSGGLNGHAPRHQPHECYPYSYGIAIARGDHPLITSLPMLTNSLYLLPLFAYGIGSIASAVIVSALFRLPDPRRAGSNNPGATNVLRLGGKKAAVLTLLGDLGKGMLPVLLARALSTEPTLIAATALAAFLGHLYPLFFNFKGGKGVATAGGVFIALDGAVALVSIAVWLVVALLFRYASLASLSAAVAAVVAVAWWLPAWQYLLLTITIAGLLMWRHRRNIARLLAGDENRLY